MIDEASLMEFSHYFPDNRQLEKDYLLNFMLKIISINKISNYLDFKGGTSLYMFNGLDRFSEDLDFTYLKTDKIVNKNIDMLIDPVIKDFQLSYKINKNKGNIITKNNKGNISGIRTEIVVEGPLFQKTGTRQRIKIDISTRNDILFKPENAKMESKYNDIGMIILYKMPLNEILAEKFCAIIERSRARDLYYIYFLLKNKNIEFNKKIFMEKLEKREEYFSNEILIKNIYNITENAWKEELGYIIKDLPGLNDVITFIIDKIQ